jgi:hypothetical protein
MAIGSIIGIAQTIGSLLNAFGLRALPEFFAKFFGGSGGGAPNDAPKQGPVDLRDEHRMLLTMALARKDEIDGLSHDQRRKAGNVLQNMFQLLLEANRNGARDKFRNILAYSATTKVTRGPTGEKVNGKDVTEEIRRDIPEDGLMITLLCYVLSIDTKGGSDPKLVISQLDTLGILDNNRDNLSQKARKIPEQFTQAYRQIAVPTAREIVEARLSKAELAKMEQDNPSLESLYVTYDALPPTQAEEKKQAAECYLDALHAAFVAVLETRKSTPRKPWFWRITGPCLVVIILFLWFILNRISQYY